MYTRATAAASLGRACLIESASGSMTRSFAQQNRSRKHNRRAARVPLFTFRKSIQTEFHLRFRAGDAVGIDAVSPLIRCHRVCGRLVINARDLAFIESGRGERLL